MNGKYYVGNKISEFESYGEVEVTGILLTVNSPSGGDPKNVSVGSNDGYVLEADCESFVENINANIMLAEVQGKVYKGYRATNAILDPFAELGDGITVHGIYSMLAFRDAVFGGGHTSEISAPGDNVVDHEFLIPEEDGAFSMSTMEAESVDTGSLLRTINELQKKVDSMQTEIDTMKRLSESGGGING